MGENRYRLHEKDMKERYEDRFYSVYTISYTYLPICPHPLHPHPKQKESAGPM